MKDSDTSGDIAKRGDNTSAKSGIQEKEPVAVNPDSESDLSAIDSEVVAILPAETNPQSENGSEPVISESRKRTSGAAGLTAVRVEEETSPTLKKARVPFLEGSEKGLKGANGKRDSLGKQIKGKEERGIANLPKRRKGRDSGFEELAAVRLEGEEDETDALANNDQEGTDYEDLPRKKPKYAKVSVTKAKSTNTAKNAKVIQGKPRSVPSSTPKSKRVRTSNDRFRNLAQASTDDQPQPRRDTRAKASKLAKHTNDVANHQPLPTSPPSLEQAAADSSRENHVSPMTDLSPKDDPAETHHNSIGPIVVTSTAKADSLSYPSRQMANPEKKAKELTIYDQTVLAARPNVSVIAGPISDQAAKADIKLTLSDVMAITQASSPLSEPLVLAPESAESGKCIEDALNELLQEATIAEQEHQDRTPSNDAFQMYTNFPYVGESAYSPRSVINPNDPGLTTNDPGKVSASAHNDKLLKAPSSAGHDSFLPREKFQLSVEQHMIHSAGVLSSTPARVRASRTTEDTLSRYLQGPASPLRQPENHDKGEIARVAPEFNSDIVKEKLAEKPIGLATISRCASQHSRRLQGQDIRNQMFIRPSPAEDSVAIKVAETEHDRENGMDNALNSVGKTDIALFDVMQNLTQVGSPSRLFTSAICLIRTCFAGHTYGPPDEEGWILRI